MKPFLKWAGNKYALMDRIRHVLPMGNRLIEPFAGSAAVFLNTDYPQAVIADSNPDLIDLYKRLQAQGKKFIAYACELFVPENNSKLVYYGLREEFNHTQDKQRKAALFLYLNRHGYNGLCRYNAKGGFNVPFGRYAKPYFPGKEMEHFYLKSQKAKFIIADFKVIMQKAKPGDVIYCDPPYTPLSSTANFNHYNKDGFGKREQDDLINMAEKCAKKTIPVVISNHNTEFTLHAYRNASITQFDVKRTISCNGSNRKKAKELLALFKAA
jgi:DNA adenine methylase